MANDHNAMTSTFSFTPPEWLKSSEGVPKMSSVALSREALAFAASCLQEQADHLKNLAECADLPEAMKCQSGICAAIVVSIIR